MTLPVQRSKSRRFWLAALLAASALLPTPSTAQTLPEWGRALTPEQGRELRAEVQRLSRQFNLRENTLVAIARVLGTNLQNTSFGQLIERVREQAQRAADLQRQLGELRRQVSTLESSIRQPAQEALGRATTAFDEGRFADADREFGALQALRSAESETARTAWVDAVEARARIAELRLEFVAAAELRLTAMREEQRLSRERQFHLSMGAARALFEQGRLRADVSAFQRSAEIYREIVLPLTPRPEYPMEWAGAEHALGLTLSYWGRLRTDTRLLDEAIVAFRAAQELWTPAAHREHWAMAQGNLADAMTALASLTNEISALEEAVAQHRTSLGPQLAPPPPGTILINGANIAARQNNLALALYHLGQRKLDFGRREEGRRHLEEAVGLLRTALILLPHGDLRWVSAETNLGMILSALGVDESTSGRLQESATEYRTALGAITRDGAPALWAQIQDNLGGTLWELGERENQDSYFEQAIEAHRLALEVYTRENTPARWAAANTNLGNALLSLGERENGTQRLEGAVTAFRAALEERTREREPTRWGTSTVAIGRARALIASRTSNLNLLDEAERQVREARSVLAAEGFPLTWTDRTLELIAGFRRTLSARR